MTQIVLPQATDFANFEPASGQVVFEPESAGAGYWVGCPSIMHDPARQSFLLTYRRRRPRGDGSDRGYQCGIAESRDGITFTPIWTVQKEELSSSSMERFALTYAPDGSYLLYISYVDPADNRWRLDVIRADQPDRFNVSQAQSIFTAANTGTEGVKDPVVLRIGPAYYLFASFAHARDFSTTERTQAHGSADIYNTGMTVFPTGVGVSRDGIHFQWLGEVLPVGAGWDRYQSRLTGIVPLTHGFLGFYDGSASVEENYEERAGLVTSFDLKHWDRLTPDSPWATSAFASGSLRYVAALPVDAQLWLYYEYARPDGAHELRHVRLTMKG